MELEPRLSDPAFEAGMLGEVLSVEEMDRLALLKQNRSKLQNNNLSVLADSISRLREATAKKELSIEEILGKKRQKNGN